MVQSDCMYECEVCLLVHTYIAQEEIFFVWGICLLVARFLFSFFFFFLV